MMCCKYAEYLVSIGKSAVLMSATFEDEHDSGSNHPIQDRRINSGTEMETVMECVDDGKRVLWFVPGYDGSNGCCRVNAA